MNEQRRLVKKLSPKVPPQLKLRRGTVVSVGSGVATIDMATGRIPDVPFYAHVTGLIAGSKVDVLMDGEAPVILGKFA